MYTLGIETSGRNATVALLKDQTVLEQQFLSESNRPDTRRLPVCVQDILNKQSLQPEHLDCLAVSRGPGSFTGLRVGLVFAKLFGYTSKVPLVAVDTFAAAVEKIVPAEHIPAGEKIEVVEDLRKGQIAWQRFSFQESHWQAEAEIEVSTIEQWIAFSRENVSFTGMSIERIKKQLDQDHPLALEKILPEELRSPDAIAVALIGQRELKKSGPVDPFELKPLYIRRSAAEEKRATQENSA